MRYILTVDFEDDVDIESFMHFVAYHTKRLKCASKDVSFASPTSGKNSW